MRGRICADVLVALRLPDQGEALDGPGGDARLGMAAQRGALPGQQEAVAATLALTFQRHDLQRLHDLVETEQRRAVARLADQQDRQAAVVDRRVAREGEIVILEGDHAHGQDHVDPGGGVGHLRVAQPRDFGFVFVEQLRALPRGQDARGLKPARDLPVGHRVARAGAESPSMAPV
jgi:hypothetical protein